MKSALIRATPERGFQQIETSLSPRNRELINQFIENKNGHVTEIRLRCLKMSLVRFADTLEKDIDKATKEEVTKIGGMILRSDMSIKSQQDIVSDVKSAFKFWFGENEYYPKVCTGLKRPKSRTVLRLPEEMLTEEQIYQIVKACNNTRDKFYIALLGLDGGLRPVEARKIRWGDVKKDKYGYFITVKTAKESGNKETRTIRIIKSEPYFIQWNKEYPAEKSDHNHVFIHYSNLKPISKSTMESLFKRLRKKLHFKRLFPYLLRHSLITRMSKDPRIPVPLLKKFIGHSLRSNTIAEYQHFGDDDLKEMQLNYNDIVKKKEEIPIERKPIICPHCKTSNEYDSEFCLNCNHALSQKRMVDGSEQFEELRKKLDAMESELQRRKKLDPLLDKLIKNPKVVELLKK